MIPDPQERMPLFSNRESQAMHNVLLVVLVKLIVNIIPTWKRHNVIKIIVN